MAESTTLLDRAKKHLRRNGPRAGALAIVPLATMTADAADVVYSLGETSVRAIVGGSGESAPVSDSIPTFIDQRITNNGSALKLYGGAGPITGQQWDDEDANYGMQFSWFGDFLGPVYPDDVLVGEFLFDLDFTGGSVRWDINAFLLINTDPPSNLSLSAGYGGTANDPGIIQGSMSGRKFGFDGNDGRYIVRIEIDWRQYSPADTIQITIPDQSIDIGINYVPEPSAFLVLGMAAMGLVGIRRG